MITHCGRNMGLFLMPVGSLVATGKQNAALDLAFELSSRSFLVSWKDLNCLKGTMFPEAPCGNSEYLEIRMVYKVFHFVMQLSSKTPAPLPVVPKLILLLILSWCPVMVVPCCERIRWEDKMATSTPPRSHENLTRSCAISAWPRWKKGNPKVPLCVFYGCRRAPQCTVLEPLYDCEPLWEHFWLKNYCCWWQQQPTNHQHQ